MFFVASVKKSSYLHTIVVASLEKKLAWLKVARHKGGDCPVPGPALFEKWYESKYWSVLLFFLSAIWSLDSKKLKVLYPSYICCSNHVIKRLSVQQCTCHATSLMPLFWQCWIYLRLVCKCFDRVLGRDYKDLVITTIWHFVMQNRDVLGWNGRRAREVEECRFCDIL